MSITRYDWTYSYESVKGQRKQKNLIGNDIDRHWSKEFKSYSECKKGMEKEMKRLKVKPKKVTISDGFDCGCGYVPHHQYDFSVSKMFRKK